jgi:ribosomal protein S12 methylthiotransferase
MKIGFVSLGCPKNLVDSEVMLGLAQAAGHTLTTDPADADVIVVNTCAFIDSAKQESIDAILEMAALTREGKRLVVAGCLAQRYREELQREIPEIDALVGTDEVPDIVRAIGGAADRHRSGVKPLHLFRRRVPEAAATTTDAVRDAARPTYLYGANTPRVLTTPQHYAYVKVAEGCDYKCAFCIIPTLRGAYRSRPAESIIAEATVLARRGVRELILISQDTTFYGVDRKERGALARLLAGLDEVEGLEWVRLLYLYPTTLDDTVLQAMARSARVCKYVDLPLQHASASVLRRMKRPGNGTMYRHLLERVRDCIPGVALRTTFIVGFPGETEEEFEELLQLVRDVRFDHVGVFTYSHEEGTTAYQMPDDVPDTVKADRQQAVMSLQQGIVEETNRAKVGRRVRLIVDGPAPEHEWVLKGRLEGQAPDIDPVVYLSDCDPAAIGPGRFVNAEIIEATGYDLVARPVDEAS